MNEYRKRINSLKSVEVLCYSLCIHLLVEEALATDAAKAALLDLYTDDQFWKLEGTERDGRVRKKAIYRSMELLTNRK
ncbi:hypothetical protein [Cohnella abietis]|uniref:Uncharacterized protein n=1 Tax=Cohnella abietis TaxID=2507935 RepID=A0A3T1D4R8_9BACL|nr:hypothetical protein [Cohnella abietis]BBI33102.1 hypothetical protein KCTCHS21_25010 [Cohnella abietis]